MANPRVDRASEGPGALVRGFDRDDVARARRWLEACPRHRPTPLRSLAGAARRLGLGSVAVKDETARLGLGTFKALGGAYAVLRYVADAVHGGDREAHPAAFDEATRVAAAALTVTCATDGNHGRSVAAGARIAGCRCVIFLHAHVSGEREGLIRALGAETRRVAGDYDDSVAAARAAAVEHGWMLVADTTADADADPVPARVMSGYGVLVEEALDACAAVPTHVFVQAGVGGLAAVVLSVAWRRHGRARPALVVVEPTGAACLAESCRAGAPVRLPHSPETRLAMLSCGEPSRAAWPVIDAGADWFLTIDDEAAFAAVRALAHDQDGDGAWAVGESGAAGLGALFHAARDEPLARALGLGPSARVLAFATEAPSDPAACRAALAGPRGA